MRAVRFGWIALLILCAQTPAQAGEDPLAIPVTREGAGGTLTLEPIPTPDLSRAEESVQRHLGEARANLADTLTQSLTPPGVPDPDLAAAYGQTGGYYLAHKLWIAAEACYANAERLDPRDPRWPYYLGYRYQQDAQPELAAGAYSRALGLNPGLTVARLRLGLLYLDLNRLDEAVPLLTVAAEDPGLRGAALWGLGRAAQARHDPAAAVPLFEQALVQDPDATQIHYALAMTYRALGKMDEARSHLARRGDGEPRIPDPLVDDLAALLSGARTLYYRGIEALRDGHFDVAVASFTEALGLEPDNVDARVTLARALYLAGDPQGAAGQLRDALERDPDHPLALYLMGTLLEEQGDEAGALDHYRRALEADPRHGGAHHALGNGLMRRGDYQGAAGHYAAARAAVPQDAPAALLQALALVRLGPDHHAQAAKVLESASGDHPQDAALAAALARLLAASQAPQVRDGPRALALAQTLFDHANTLEHAETLAMAQAEAGDTAGAAALQNNALLATAAAGRFGDLPRLQANLALYQAGKPCRTPWSDQDPVFYPPPQPARGPMQEYPTRAAY
jgi:tetratricopeptide (TPR) repeat protein